MRRRLLALAAAAALVACEDAGEGAPDAVDPHAEHDVFRYDPDDVPDNLSEGGGAGSEPDDPEVVYLGAFSLEALDPDDESSGWCVGEADLIRKGPTVSGVLVCDGEGSLAALGHAEHTVSGDAGGDGRLTLEVTVEGQRVVLQGDMDDAHIDLHGEERARVGGLDLYLLADVTCDYAR